jgi:hypothetical protein
MTMKRAIRIVKFFLLMPSILILSVLSANALRPKKEGKLQSFLVEDDVHIFKGALVCLNDAGYVEPATNAADKVLAGVAYEECDNTLAGHSQGGKSIRLYREGLFKFASSGITQAEVGLYCYVSDDDMVEDAGVATQGVIAGVVVELVSTDIVWVDIEPGIYQGALSTTPNADGE